MLARRREADKRMTGTPARPCARVADADRGHSAMSTKAAIALLLVAGLARGEDPPVSIPGPQDAPPGDRFDPGQLKSTLVVPATPVRRFRYPVIDAHSHAYGKTPEAVAEWVKLMDR